VVVSATGRFLLFLDLADDRVGGQEQAADAGVGHTARDPARLGALKRPLKGRLKLPKA